MHRSRPCLQHAKDGTAGGLSDPFAGIATSKARGYAAKTNAGRRLSSQESGMKFKRYAVYFTPPPGPLADFGAAWLGWDPENGVLPAPVDLHKLNAVREEMTATPRKYGFHATLKPPFRLADGYDLPALQAATRRLAQGAQPFLLEGLQPALLGRFLALVPEGETTTLDALAAETVRALDAFRAPLTEAELAKRRANALSPRQVRLLLKWGYPYVMETFRFHMTLTGKLPKAQAAEVLGALAPVLQDVVSRPFPIDALSLMGEDEAGWFHLIERCALGR